MCSQKERGLIFWLFMFLVISESCALASPAFASSNTVSTMPAPSLEADARLDRKISLDEKGVSLEELLRSVSDNDLRLGCSNGCRDQKVQIRIEEQPLRNLMEELAQLIPGKWQPIGSGYQLDMDQEAVDYRNRWWQLYLNERARMLSQMKSLVLASIRAQPYSPGPGFVNKEHTPQRYIERMAEQQRFWNELPSNLQDQIANQLIDTAFYRSGAVYVGKLQEGAVVVPFDTLPEDAQESARASASRLNGGKPVGDPTVISFNNAGFVVRAHLQTSDGKWWDLDAILHPPISFVASALPLFHPWLPKLVKQLGSKAPQSWKQLSEYQEHDVWVNDPPTHPSQSMPPPPRSEVLDWLANQANIQFVSDYYSIPAGSLTPNQKKQHLSRPLKEELDYRAAEGDFSWKQEDGVYLFRDNRWYRDDKLEVPNETLQSLLRNLKACGEMTGNSHQPSSDEEEADQLSLLVNIAHSLTPWQIANGLANYSVETSDDSSTPPHDVVWHPFADISNIIIENYNTLAFIATLSSDQLNAVIGRGLPASALNSSQLGEASFISSDVQVAAQNNNLNRTLLRLKLELGAPATVLGGPEPNDNIKIRPLQISMVVDTNSTS